MVRDGSCPAWCAEHVVGAGADQHRVTLGDVRLTLAATSDGWQATVAMRRRAGRTRAETTQLTVNMSAAGDLLRRECGRRHVFRGNTVHDPATIAIAWV
jgi:hypothetical protein